MNKTQLIEFIQSLPDNIGVHADFVLTREIIAPVPSYDGLYDLLAPDDKDVFGTIKFELTYRSKFSDCIHDRIAYKLKIMGLR